VSSSSEYPAERLCRSDTSSSCRANCPGPGPSSHDECAAGREYFSLTIDSLRTEGSPRIAGEDMGRVRALADQEWPPIVVHRATRWVIDGRHRIKAAVLDGRQLIPARLFDGDDDAAFMLAIRLNVTDGYPLTLADRKAAAARIVTTRGDWSDRMIASVTGLSPRTIGEVRKAMRPTAAVRVGRDGRSRPVDIAARKAIARDALERNPRLSLRQVARVAGISPETVRAVRAELFPDAARGEVRPAVDPHRDGPPGAALARPSVIDGLRIDPTLRFTDSGRALLRVLEAHEAGTRVWPSIAGAVPNHCRDSVAAVALECAKFWQSVVRTLS
jgi:ParB-like chromosome segregation protein Spo0J